MVEQAHAESEGPSIEDADVIVAGGRGLGAPENFKLVEELAQALGGAVAATRAVVDAGWYPYSAQVGQTGKTVSPKLYVAVGISGAIQHKVGMQSSRHRSSPSTRTRNAPIFEFADLGVVGDLHEIVPKLTKLVKPAQDLTSTRPTFRRRSTGARRSRSRRDPEDERIEVGVADRRRGPAGLACAIRLGQLLEEEPETAERLGDVPVAVLEKGKQAGAHLLSGAVVNPRSLRTLFRERKRIADMPFYGEVPARTVYFLTRHQTVRMPAPPTMKNHHNHVASLSRFGRWLAEEAEAAGAMILPETAATKLLVDDGRVRGVHTGDRGRGRRARSCRTSSRAPTIVGDVTVLCEGTQGHLTGAALEQFGLASETRRCGRSASRRSGVRGRSTASSTRWAGRSGRPALPRVRRLRSSIRSATTWSPSGWSSGSTTATPSSRCTNLLQELKTHPLVRAHPRRRRARSSGARRRSRRAGSSRCRSACTRRGCCSAATAPASSTCRR